MNKGVKESNTGYKDSVDIVAISHVLYLPLYALPNNAVIPYIYT